MRGLLRRAGAHDPNMSHECGVEAHSNLCNAIPPIPISPRPETLTYILSPTGSCPEIAGWSSSAIPSQSPSCRYRRRALNINASILRRANGSAGWVILDRRCAGLGTMMDTVLADGGNISFSQHEFKASWEEKGQEGREGGGQG